MYYEIDSVGGGTESRSRRVDDRREFMGAYRFQDMNGIGTSCEFVSLTIASFVVPTVYHNLLTQPVYFPAINEFRIARAASNTIHPISSVEINHSI